MAWGKRSVAYSGYKGRVNRAYTPIYAFTWRFHIASGRRAEDVSGRMRRQGRHWTAVGVRGFVDGWPSGERKGNWLVS
jgi:hypothetical protein